MPKPNYQFEKRARELAKKQKKEEKLKRRQENAAKGNGGETEADAGDQPDGVTPEGSAGAQDSSEPSREGS